MIERPRDALLKLMKDKGLHRLTSSMWLHRKRLERLGFQYVAVEMLVREAFINAGIREDLRVVFSEEFGGEQFEILLGKGGSRADSILSDRRIPGAPTFISWRELSELLPDPPFPLFIVDMSLRYIHTDEELERLRLQILVSLGVIREYLWDRHFAVTSADKESQEWLRTYMGSNKAVVTDTRPNELLWSLGADSVIILRPDAPQTLDGEDVMKANAFLIGGVVDLIPRKGVSRVLDNLVPWGIPRRLSLRGSIIGVPERINRIIEILLKARYIYDGDVEKAIISAMTKRDIQKRLFVEIMRAARGHGDRRYVTWDYYYELKSWLPITPSDFLEAAKKTKVSVRGEPPGDLE